MLTATSSSVYSYIYIYIYVSIYIYKHAYVCVCSYINLDVYITIYDMYRFAMNPLKSHRDLLLFVPKALSLLLLLLRVRGLGSRGRRGEVRSSSSKIGLTPTQQERAEYEVIFKLEQERLVYKKGALTSQAPPPPSTTSHTPLGSHLLPPLHTAALLLLLPGARVY